MQDPKAKEDRSAGEEGSEEGVGYIYNWLPSRSVLSRRLKRVLDPSGTYITQERSVPGLVLNITLRIIIHRCPCSQGYSGGSASREVSSSREARAVSEENTVRREAFVLFQPRTELSGGLKPLRCNTRQGKP